MKRGIDREILRLAVPSILANITVPLVGMADIAVSGHLDKVAGSIGAAALVGGIAIGSMIFDFLYWNFAFLRVGTGGLTAQAFGRRDMVESRDIFTRAISTAFVSGLALIALQWIVTWITFHLVDCTPEVRHFAEQYFYIRIWAAPATLSLFAFKGWFIGMQDSVSPMATDILVNVVNVALSVILTFGIGSWNGLGFKGVAYGTFIAQWTGFFFAAAIVFLKYGRRVFSGWSLSEGISALRDTPAMKRFFSLNTDLMVRSLAMLAIYIGFTIISARYGDVLLAVGAILMKILMLFSYFTDGFAYAGEALTGRFIGENNSEALRQSIRRCFVWSMGLAVFFIGIYYIAGVPLLRLMTSDHEVVSAAVPYLPWLLVMPILGCPAFMWDGIFVGATKTKALRDNTLWSAIGFFTVWFAGVAILRPSPASAIHLLMAAYFTHLIVRAAYLTAYYLKKGISP